jgi:gamma-glutamyltranspeptidase/glutathione hydrolase
VKVPVDGLLDPAYLASRAALIGATAGPPPMAGNPPGARAMASAQAFEPGGTSHMVVADARGDVLSMTTTVESLFGTGRMVEGFFLNNQLTDFSFVPTTPQGAPVANAPAPGKRPMSAMSPTIVFDGDGRFKIALGSPGGPIIIPYVAESLVAMLDGGLDPQSTAALPHHANPNGPTLLEEGTPIVDYASALAAMGHRVATADLESGLNIIERVKDGYIGGSDPRRDGIAKGE